MAANAREVLSGVARKVFDVPVWLSCAEWADQFAYFVIDKNASKYRTASDPYARSILNLIHRPGLRAVAYMKAEQVGGTEKLNRIIGYTVDRRPCATMVVYPTATVAGRQNVEKITPSIEATPALRARLGPAARDKKTLAINFDRMRLTMVGAPPGKKPDANLEAHSYGAVFVDELDRCHPDVPDTVQGRGKARAKFLLWMQGTPGYAGQGIDRQYNGAEDLPASDRGRFWLPCPHDDCRQYHVREFRHVRWPGRNKAGEFVDDSRDVQADPEEVRRRAWYKCPHCRGKIGAEHNLWQAERHVLLTSGQSIGRWGRGESGEFTPGIVEGAPSRSPRAGVHQGGLYTCFPADVNPYGYVAEGFVKSKGRPTETWVNRVLGEAWSVKGQSVEVNDLRSLCVPAASGGYRMGTVPSWGLVLVATIDVQAGSGGHAWVWVWALGEGSKNRALVSVQRSRWTEGSKGEEIDATVDRVFVRQGDGRRMKAALELVDEGDRTDEVIARARRRKREGRFSFTTKGVGLRGGAETLGLYQWGWIDRLGDGSPDTSGPRRLRYNVFVWKRACHRMMRPAGSGKTEEDDLAEALGEGVEAGPVGRLFLPEDTPEEFLRQMAAEHLAPEKKRGSSRVTYAYQMRPGFTDNHAFDGFVMMTAGVDALPELRSLRVVAAPSQAPHPKQGPRVDQARVGLRGSSGSFLRKH